MIRFPRLLLFLYNNRGTVLLQAQQNAEAIAQYRRAVALARALNSEPLLPPILANLARALISDEKFDEADAVVREGMGIVRRNGGKGPEAQLLAIAADSAYHRGQLERARGLIERTQAILHSRAFTLDDRLELKGHLAFVSHHVRDSANAIMAAAGASSFHLDQPLQRFWRDLNTVCSHAFWDWDSTRELVGRQQLGLEPNHPLV